MNEVDEEKDPDIKYCVKILLNSLYGAKVERAILDDSPQKKARD